MSRIAALLAAATVLLACAPAEAQVSWRRREATRTVPEVPFANRELDESSGLAASRAHPGLLWTIEDSETGPYLFATDTLGRDHGRWEIEHADNWDWESIRLGRCPRGACLYVGDTGDNAANRDRVSIYRIPEPDPTAAGTHDLFGVETLTFRYPEGSHNVEAMVVTPAQDLLLISKGEKGPPALYRIPAGAWKSKSPVTAEALGTLPLPDAGLTGRVTDAALSPDGRRIAVRTYVDIYFFELDARGGGLAPAKPPIVCGIFGLQLQGEGIDWLDARRLAVSGERAFGFGGGIAIVECPAR